ncbi:MAG: TetR family transcriptional regulator [Rhodobacteraceae bacterium]|jgi:TetR/AcrR family transcriptional regulator, transcriptional repressor of bet genes|nr:TetR family transcriptional regulator [Paracoccaceae bacterium]
MSNERRTYRREGEERRREALVSAAIDIIAQSGPEAATVRAIAERAGVTPGLIRHYFSNKDELTRTAYVAMMGQMAAANKAAIDAIPGDAVTRVAVCVVNWLRPSVMEPGALIAWAGFVPAIRSDLAMRRAHSSTYLAFRDQWEGLIAALPGHKDAAQITALATACNALIDGLWFEGSLQREALDPDMLAAIGLDGIGAILGVDLRAALPKEM